MATPLLDMIRSFIPNFTLKELRGMIPWFEAVSDAVNGAGSLVAMAEVDAGGNLQKNFGFTTVVDHPSIGQFTLHLVNSTYGINDLSSQANIRLLVPSGAVNIYPRMSGNDEVSLNIFQVTTATAALIPIDADFTVFVFKGQVDL